MPITGLSSERIVLQKSNHSIILTKSVHIGREENPEGCTLK